MDGEPIVSSLLSKEDDREVPLCGCMSVRYYQPFFDIETEDVTRRITTAAFYFRKDDSFMGLIRDRPDAYGPFWVSRRPLHSPYSALMNPNTLTTRL